MTSKVAYHPVLNHRVMQELNLPTGGKTLDLSDAFQDMSEMDSWILASQGMGLLKDPPPQQPSKDPSP
jgi:hypothetical protein